MATTASAWARSGASLAPTTRAASWHGTAALPGTASCAPSVLAAPVVIGPVVLTGACATADLRRRAPSASAAKVATGYSGALRRPAARTRTGPSFGPHAGAAPSAGRPGSRVTSCGSRTAPDRGRPPSRRLRARSDPCCEPRSGPRRRRRAAGVGRERPRESVREARKPPSSARTSRRRASVVGAARQEGCRTSCPHTPRESPVVGT